MSFTPEQTGFLSAKLDGSAVKQRKQGSTQVSYVEAWHVIAEANRIFGFDGWTRETLMAECVYSGEYQKAIWENNRKTDRTMTMFRCTYNARVRVTAGGVFRDGTGSGHGFGENPGDAHESAVKEAETDAMKRALMTFGNPFGLALYDKTQADVERGDGQGAHSHAAHPTTAQAGAGGQQKALPRNEQFFRGKSYEITPADAGGTLQRWEQSYRTTLAACRNLDELCKVETDNSVWFAKFCDKARPEVIEDIRQIIVASTERLKRGIAA